MEEINELDIRDEFFTQIHEMKPKWWMRWAILIVFLILMIIISLGIIVKYPDVIVSEFKLTTNSPSITLPFMGNAQVEKIFIKNGDKVKPGTNILVVNNNSNYKDIFYLEEQLNTFSFQRDSILAFFKRHIGSNLELADDLENSWTLFSTELLEYYKIEELESYQLQISSLSNELTKQLELKKHYEDLQVTDDKHIGLLDQKIRTDSILYAKGVTSKMEYNAHQRDYLNRKESLHHNELELERLNLQILKLQSSIKIYTNGEKEKLTERQLGIRKSFNKLKASIKSWKFQYLLTSPIEGKVVFLQELKKNSFFKGNAVVIVPEGKNFYAQLRIPLVGAGKMEEGQRVILKLNDYPYKEYGTLEGALTKFSVVSEGEYYLGSVREIKNNLKLTKNKNILLKENISGIAEIVTKDRSVIGRVFEKIIYAFNQ